MRGARIGPLAVKLLLDMLLAVTAARLVRARRPDTIHSCQHRNEVSSATHMFNSCFPA